MKNLCVGITGLDISDNPMSGLGIAKCLKLNKNIKVLGISYDPLSPGCYTKDIFDEVHLIDNPLQNKDSLFEEIIRIKEKSGLEVVIPAIPEEVPAFAALKKRFKRRKIKIITPQMDEVINILDPKVFSFVSYNRVKIPPYIFISDKRNLAKKVSFLRFPLIIKSVAENYKAHDINEAEVFVSSYFQFSNDPICIQEYINGEEYSLTTLADENSKLYGMVVIKKLVLTDQGAPWIVVSVVAKELIDFTKKLVKHFKWTGPIELTFKKDVISYSYNLIRLQPCFPSWIYLAAKIGQNLPLKAIKLAMGKAPMASMKYKTGHMYIRNTKDIACDIHTFFSLTSSRRLIHNG
ncbi:MAG: hypothetical protein MAG551_01054 [Candidatus Scalindua arabica]|uniref:ATP-grasp domain-containing protein n=1 Tax=Candidatus Scalindua arabica TaxID=1127984 RepID=A0A942A1U3_9BACT|nr:hypothetical protein [Candidatus Scalindua arabica]